MWHGFADLFPDGRRQRRGYRLCPDGRRGSKRYAPWRSFAAMCRQHSVRVKWSPCHLWQPLLSLGPGFPGICRRLGVWPLIDADIGGIADSEYCRRADPPQRLDGVTGFPLIGVVMLQEMSGRSAGVCSRRDESRLQGAAFGQNQCQNQCPGGERRPHPCAIAHADLTFPPCFTLACAVVRVFMGVRVIWFGVLQGV